MEGTEVSVESNMSIEQYPLFTIVVSCKVETAIKLQIALCDIIAPTYRYSGVSHTKEEWARVWDAKINPEIPLVHNFDIWTDYEQVPDMGHILQAFGISKYQIVKRDNMLSDQALTRLSIKHDNVAPEFTTHAGLLTADDSMDALLNSINWTAEF
jgi:hypothetical protein